jgi:putative RNA 2'-phosphotransferase
MLGGITNQMKISTTHIQLITTWLRHKPFKAGFKLDDYGWVGIEDLLKSLKENDILATLEDLETINNAMPIKRWEIDSVKNKIRATHGHSVPIKIDLPFKKPPRILYHGSKIDLIPAVLKYGILPMWRQFVNLSSEEENAIEYSEKKNGHSIIFGVSAEEMFINDFIFYNPQKTIWITRFIPLDYLFCNSWFITRDVEKLNAIYKVTPVENSIYIYSDYLKKVIIYNNLETGSNIHSLLTINSGTDVSVITINFEQVLNLLTG